MKPKKRQKLCYNCEGEIDLDVIVCPFCAADLRAEKPEQQRVHFQAASARPLHSQEMSQSLYPPPYARERAESIEATIQPTLKAQPPLEETALVNREIWPILLFAVGSQLLVLGLLLAICSHHGVVTLQWDARMWFLYLFVSIPFLVFGYRALSKSPQD